MTVLKRSAIGTPMPTYWIAVAPVILAVEGHAVTTSLAGVLRQILTPATVYVSGRLFERAANLAGQINAVRIVASDHGSAGIAEVAGAAAAALAVAGVPVTQIITEMTLEQAQSGHVAVLIVSLLVMAVVMAAVGMIGLASSQGTNVTERIREFGIMRTIGASGGAFIRNILAEGALVGLLSLPVSVLVGLPLGYAIGLLVGTLSFGLPLPLAFSATALGSG